MKAMLLGLLLALPVARAAKAQTNAQPLAVRSEPIEGGTRLVLVAAPGWKINARLKPALELPNGAVVRFDAARRTPDSAYFAESPIADVPGKVTNVRGTLKASVCSATERFCRLLTLKL